MGSPVTEAWFKSRVKDTLPGLRPHSAKTSRVPVFYATSSHTERRVYIPKRPSSHRSPERRGRPKAKLPSNTGPLHIPHYISGFAALDLLAQYRSARRDFLAAAKKRSPPPQRRRPQSARPFRARQEIFKSVHFQSLEKLNKAK